VVHNKNNLPVKKDFDFL